MDTHSETAGLMISHIAFIKSDHIHVHCALYKCITHTRTVEPPNKHNSTLYTIFTSKERTYKCTHTTMDKITHPNASVI